jgi:hypothetical protein
MVLAVVRKMGPMGSNAGSIVDALIERGDHEAADHDVVYRRTFRSLKALQEQGLVKKVGLNYYAMESEIQKGLLRQLACAVAEVASTSAAAADIGLIRAALQGVMDELDSEAQRSQAPLIGKDVASRILDE